jgi:hypothetical protein
MFTKIQEISKLFATWFCPARCVSTIEVSSAGLTLTLSQTIYNK